MFTYIMKVIFKNTQANPQQWQRLDTAKKMEFRLVGKTLLIIYLLNFAVLPQGNGIDHSTRVIGITDYKNTEKGILSHDIHGAGKSDRIVRCNLK